MITWAFHLLGLEILHSPFPHFSIVFECFSYFHERNSINLFPTMEFGGEKKRNIYFRLSVAYYNSFGGLHLLYSLYLIIMKLQWKRSSVSKLVMFISIGMFHLGLHALKTDTKILNYYCLRRNIFLFFSSSWGSKIKSLFLMIIEKQSVLCLKGFTELFAIRRLPELVCEWLASITIQYNTVQRSLVSLFPSFPTLYLFICLLHCILLTLFGTL